jgi:hypothetical protein
MERTSDFAREPGPDAIDTDAVAQPAPALAPTPGAGRTHRATPALALALGVVAAAAVLPLLPARVPAPDLAPLLFGMAAIKGLLVALGGAALTWRFGFAVERGIARRYLLALALGASAAVLIAGHVVPMTGAALFHVGELLFLVTAWQDGRTPR